MSSSWDLDDRTFRLGLLVLALVLMFVHWNWLVRGLPIYGNDSSLFYPTDRDMARWLAAGRFPQWSDRYFCGQPLAAESNFFLYHPLHLVLLRWAGTHADGIWTWLHALLAAGGMAAFCRTLGLSRAASLLTACSYPLSGFFVGHVIHPNTFAEAAWIPLQLALVERIRLQSGPLNAALLAAACGLQWLSGQPQIALLTNYCLALYCLLRSVVFPASGPARAFAPFLVTSYAQVLGALLAAVQLLPLHDVLAQAGRLSGLPYEFAASAPLPPWGLALPILPAVYGVEGPSDQAVFWLSKTASWTLRGLGSWEFHFYPGAVVTILALYAVRHRLTDPLCRTLVVIALVGVLFALGGWTPVHWILWHLPGIDAGRVPTRTLLFTTISLIVLAGLAFDDIAVGRKSRQTAWLRVFVTTLIFAMAVWTIGGMASRFSGTRIYLVVQTRILSTLGQSWAAATSIDEELQRDQIAQAGIRGVETVMQMRASTSPWSVATATNLALVVAGGLIVLGWMRSSPNASSRWMLGVVAVLCFDLLWFGRTFGARAAADPDPHAPPTYAASLDPAQRVLSLVNPDDARSGSWNQYRAALPSHLTAAWGFDTPDGNTGLAPMLFMRDLIIPLTDPLVPGRERLRRAVLFTDRLRLLGVGAVVAGADWGPTPWPLLYEGEGIRVWQVPNPLTRAFTVAPAELDDVRWQTLNSGTTIGALAEDRFGDLLRSAQPIRPIDAEEFPDEVEYEVTSPEPTVLVRTTRTFSGWHAYVDGDPALLEKALGFFQAVRVPAGKHRVRFEFRSGALRLGLLLTVVGCVLLLSLLIAAARQPTRRDPAPSTA